MAWPASSPSWDILNKLMYGSYRQFLAYNANLFNQNTRGGLLLSAGADIQGDYEKMSFFKELTGLVIDRDITSEADLAVKQFEMDNIARVKYAKGTPLVKLLPHQWDWIAKSPEEGMAMLGEQLAEQTLADNLKTAVSALVAANKNVGATLVYDGTAGTATLTGLTDTAQLWGDRSGNVVCWLMHSKVYNDLQKAGLANAQNLFTIGNVSFMQDQTGRPFIVSDLAELTYTITGPATRYNVIGLAPGAVKIEAGQEFRSLWQEIGGKANIQTAYQAQWTNNIELKGFGWNTSVVKPTSAQIATGTNWIQKVSSVKDCGAVIGTFM